MLPTFEKWTFCKGLHRENDATKQNKSPKILIRSMRTPALKVKKNGKQNLIRKALNQTQ